MAKGKWCVASEKIDGTVQYAAVRKKDAFLSATEDNIERAGTWCTDRKAVEALVTYLNDKEAEG